MKTCSTYKIVVCARHWRHNFVVLRLCVVVIFENPHKPVELIGNFIGCEITTWQPCELFIFRTVWPIRIKNMIFFYEYGW